MQLCGFTQSLTKILRSLCETEVILTYLGFKPERPIMAETSISFNFN